MASETSEVEDVSETTSLQEQTEDKEAKFLQLVERGQYLNIDFWMSGQVLPLYLEQTEACLYKIFMGGQYLNIDVHPSSPPPGWMVGIGPRYLRI